MAIPLYSAIGYFPSVCLLFLSFVTVVDHVVVVFIVTLNLDIFFRCARTFLLTGS